jgi:hypothetical protein
MATSYLAGVASMALMPELLLRRQIVASVIVLLNVISNLPSYQGVAQFGRLVSRAHRGARQRWEDHMSISNGRSHKGVAGRILCALFACFTMAAALTACNSGDSAVPDSQQGGGSTVSENLQSIKHVFVITMENKSFSDTFGTSTQDPYLQKTLVPAGALLTEYYGTGHVSLDNYISMLSGQPSAPDTQSDCTTGFKNINQTGTTADGLLIGTTGCIYPATVKTLPDQLKAINLTWKGYMGDMGNDPTREAATCGHPAIGTVDMTQSAQAPTAAVPLGDQYATRHDPFVYFHSIIDSSDCATNVVALTKLESDLKSVDTTANFTFITPNLCDDGHDGDGTGAAGKTCVNGQPGGLTSIDAFLKNWVPKIMASPAYQKDGLLVINFDESGDASQATTINNDGSSVTTVTLPGNSCCGQQIGPNVTRPTVSTIALSAKASYEIHYDGVGGDRTGAVLLSKFIKPGTSTSTPYNHYSMLKSLEDIFQTKGYLGYAGQTGLVPFGKDIFTNFK